MHRTGIKWLFLFLAMGSGTGHALTAQTVPPPPNPGLEVSVRAAEVIAEVEILAGGPFHAVARARRLFKGQAPRLFELVGFNSLNGNTASAGFPTGGRFILFLSRTEKDDVFAPLTPTAPRLRIDSEGVMLKLGDPPFQIPIKQEAMTAALELMLEREKTGSVPERSYEVIKGFWDSEEIELRYLAVAVAGIVKEPRALPLLIEAGQARLLKLQQTAIESLEKWATPEALQALRALTRSTGSTVSLEAAQALIRLGDLGGVDGMLDWAQKASRLQTKYPKGDPRRARIQGVVNSLRGLLDHRGSLLDAQKLVPSLLELARGSDETIARDAIYLLGRLGGKAQVAALIELADDPEFKHRQDMEQALFQITLRDPHDLEKFRSWWKDAQAGFGERYRQTVVDAAVHGMDGELLLEEGGLLKRVVVSAPAGISLVAAASKLMTASTADTFEALDLVRWRSPLSLPFLLARCASGNDMERRGALLGLAILAEAHERVRPLVAPYIRGHLSDDYVSNRRVAVQSAGFLRDGAAMGQLLDRLRWIGSFEVDDAAQSVYFLSARTLGYGPYEPTPDLMDAADRFHGWWQAKGQEKEDWRSPVPGTRRQPLAPVFSLADIKEKCMDEDSQVSGAAFALLWDELGPEDPFWQTLAQSKRGRDRGYAMLGLLPGTKAEEQKPNADRFAALKNVLTAAEADETSGDLVKAQALLALVPTGGPEAAQWLSAWLTTGAGSKAGLIWKRLAVVCLGLADGEKESLALLSTWVDEGVAAGKRMTEGPADPSLIDLEEDAREKGTQADRDQVALLRAVVLALCARADGTQGLVRALAVEEDGIRETALRALAARRHTPSMEAIFGALSRTSNYRVGDLVKIVAPLIRAGDVAFLRSMLSRVEIVSRIAAAALLALRSDLITDQDTVSALLTATTDESDEVKAQAAVALGHIRSKAAIPNLITLLQEWDSDIKANAAEALAAIGDQEGCAAAAAEAKGMYKIDARWARALGIHGGEDELAMLIRFSKSVRWIDQRVGIDALGVCGRSEALARLVEIYRNDEAEFQSHAALALAFQGDRAVKALDTEKDLKSEKGSDRARAVYALSRVRTRMAVEKLVAALGDSETSALANFSLQRLSGGRDAGFDPEGTPAQRAAACQKWLEILTDAFFKSDLSPGHQLPDR